MTIQEKLNEAPESDFVNSLRSQFAETGVLTLKQQIALDNILENKYASKISYKQHRYDDSEPESLSDLLI